MKMNQTILSSAIAAGFTFVAGTVFAQAPAAEAPAQPEAPEGAPKAPAAEVAPAPATVEEAPAEKAPAEEAPAEEAPAEEAPADEAAEAPAEKTAAEEAPAEEAAEEEGGASAFVFADAWAGWQSAKSGTPDGGGDVYASNGPTGTAESGFGLSFLGADLGYDGGMWAVNGSLRFGDGATIYGTGTLGPVTNAYVSYRPIDGLSLDLGTFGTMFGAEVAESWKNLNYTRGELYFNMQPFWHTGLRAEYAVGDFVIRGMAANDPNTSNLGGGAINAAAQVGYSGESFAIYAGGLQSLKPDTSVANGSLFDTFFDVVATASVGDLRIVGNFDMNLGYEAAAFWGASLAAGYQIVPAFGVAVRGEYLASGDDFLYAQDLDGDGETDDEDDSLATVTLTLDLKPIPEKDNLVIRLDGRMEFASEEVYANGDATDTTETWSSVTLGVVGHHDLL